MKAIMWGCLFAVVPLFIFTWIDTSHIQHSINDEKITLNECKVMLQDIQKNMDSMKACLYLTSETIMKLVPSLIEKESNFNPNAVNKRTKSYGAAQIQLPTANSIIKNDEITKEDLYNPYVNPFLATILLDKWYKKYHKIKLTLARYNGALRIDSCGAMKIINKNYHRSIMKAAGIKEN